MRWLVAGALVTFACGARSPEPQAPADDTESPVPVIVEWKVDQGDGNQVNVALVVDGRKVALGALDAATEHEAGTPATCGLRAASPRRTEIVCGDTNGFAADLVGNELLVTYVANEQPSEVKRVPVLGNTLTVKMLVLPGSKL